MHYQLYLADTCTLIEPVHIPGTDKLSLYRYTKILSDLQMHSKYIIVTVSSTNYTCNCMSYISGVLFSIYVYVYIYTLSVHLIVCLARCGGGGWKCGVCIISAVAIARFHPQYHQSLTR